MGKSGRIVKKRREMEKCKWKENHRKKSQEKCWKDWKEMDWEKSRSIVLKPKRNIIVYTPRLILYYFFSFPFLLFYFFLPPFHSLTPSLAYSFSFVHTILSASVAPMQKRESLQSLLNVRLYIIADHQVCNSPPTPTFNSWKRTWSYHSLRVNLVSFYEFMINQITMKVKIKKYLYVTNNQTYCTSP